MPLTHWLISVYSFPVSKVMKTDWNLLMKVIMVSLIVHTKLNSINYFCNLFGFNYLGNFPPIYGLGLPLRIFMTVSAFSECATTGQIMHWPTRYVFCRPQVHEKIKTASVHKECTLLLGLKNHDDEYMMTPLFPINQQIQWDIQDIGHWHNN